VVPKTIHLVELLNDELGGHPPYFDNQFTSIARDVAGFFSHSKSDSLLAELFSNRSLPTKEFEMAVSGFLDAFVVREKTARSLPAVTPD
jgi:hypothetical protein